MKRQSYFHSYHFFYYPILIQIYHSPLLYMLLILCSHSLLKIKMRLLRLLILVLSWHASMHLLCILSNSLFIQFHSLYLLLLFFIISSHHLLVILIYIVYWFLLILALFSVFFIVLCCINNINYLKRNWIILVCSRQSGRSGWISRHLK